jgi:uncharacterized phage-like protein YoqJ
MTVCFTGHRPDKLGGYNESNPIMTSVRKRLTHEIRRLLLAGNRTFITGMALGIDQLAADIVLELKAGGISNIRLIAAVPFIGQERMWPPTSQRKFHEILAKCDEVVHVCEAGYAAWKMQKRNEWMVDHAEIVIAVWDGTAGGTGNCVKYAERAANKPEIIRIDPKLTEVSSL